MPELRAHLTTEKDAKTRELLKAAIANFTKQIALLVKQMDIGLPYDRDEFKKSMTHPDIKIRRELCFKLIKSFNRGVERSNIEAVVDRLLKTSKYKQNQTRLIVGRESRAFGNQAYLFANSKLIQVNEELKKEAKILEKNSSIDSLKQTISQSLNNISKIFVSPFLIILFLE
jgi:hypothetical protein